MDRVIAVRSKGKNPAPDPLDVLFDILIEEGGSVPTVYEHHTEKDMNLALLQPWCSIGSDGLALATEGPLRRGNPHPRASARFRACWASTSATSACCGWRTPSAR